MDSAAELEPKKEASLLGIPRELRLAIYKHVYTTDLDNEIVQMWDDLFADGSGSTLKSSKNTLKVPWLCLMLTCKTTAIELRSAMSQRAFIEAEENTMYSFSLQAYSCGRLLGATTWSRLPCAPNLARSAEVRYNASSGFQAWGNGGPNPIVRSLFRTMNHLIHCGPRLDPQHLLATPMRIHKMIIKVEIGPAPDEGNKQSHTEAEREKSAHTILYEMGSLVGSIVRTGVLKGFIDTICMSYKDETLHWNPENVEGEGVPSEWSGYGFD